MKPVLRDHCHERPPVLTDPTFLAEGPTFQYNCHQRPPVLTDHISVVNRVVFQERFYCIEFCWPQSPIHGVYCSTALPVSTAEYLLTHQFSSRNLPCGLVVRASVWGAGGLVQFPNASHRRDVKKCEIYTSQSGALYQWLRQLTGQLGGRIMVWAIHCCSPVIDFISELTPGNFHAQMFLDRYKIGPNESSYLYMHGPKSNLVSYLIWSFRVPAWSLIHFPSDHWRPVVSTPRNTPTGHCPNDMSLLYSKPGHLVINTRMCLEVFYDSTT